MLSQRSIFQEIRANDEAFQLFCSIAAKGERQGGWENERIAAGTADRELAAKIARHGADEYKHGRLFDALLNKRQLSPVRVPKDTDYCALLEQKGIGLSHARLHEERPFSDEEILKYLVHSRVTEQRALEEVVAQEKVFRGDPELSKPISMIAADERDHLRYCHEELLRFARHGYGDVIRSMLKEYALVEIQTYRDVSVAVMTRIGWILGWPKWKIRLLTVGIYAVYRVERAWTWRRMTTLRQPTRTNAVGSPAVAG